MEAHKMAKPALTAKDAKDANQAMDQLLTSMSPRCKLNLDATALNTICLFLERAARELPDQFGKIEIDGRDRFQKGDRVKLTEEALQKGIRIGRDRSLDNAKAFRARVVGFSRVGADVYIQPDVGPRRSFCECWLQLDQEANG
jgi:hypothetical protein